MTVTQTISVTEFKAKCLDLFDRLGEHTLERVLITKRGRVVAVLSPPEQELTQVQGIYGCLAGRVVVPPSVDLTDPIVDEPFGVESGELHG